MPHPLCFFLIISYAKPLISFSFFLMPNPLYLFLTVSYAKPLMLFLILSYAKPLSFCGIRSEFVGGGGAKAGEEGQEKYSLQYYWDGEIQFQR